MNSHTARSTRSLLPAVGLGFLLLGFLSLLFLPMPSHTFLLKAVNNFGHVPLFGFVAILLVWISRRFLKPSGLPGLRDYGVALLGVLVLALLTESLQSLTVTRSSTLSDVFHDLLGGSCGLVFFFTYDAHLSGSWVQWRQFPRHVILRVCVVLVLGIILLPVFEWAHAYWDRANRFPALLQFSSDLEMKFVKATDSTLQVVDPPVSWKKMAEDKVGQVVFHAKTYPGIRIDEPYPDWRGYTYLQFDIFSELKTTQTIVIRIDDVHHNNEHSDRFNKAFTISPGLNHIQIPLDDIRVAPAGREFDLSAIQTVILFSLRPSQKFSLFVDDIELVKDSSLDAKNIHEVKEFLTV